MSCIAWPPRCFSCYYYTGNGGIAQEAAAPYENFSKKQKMGLTKLVFGDNLTKLF
jgi:hypothetical protein